MLSKFEADLIFKGWFTELTTEECVFLFNSGWWNELPTERVALWQLRRVKLAMPFHIFREMLDDNLDKSIELNDAFNIRFGWR